jgi:predicted porin
MAAALSCACSQRAINSPPPRAKRLLFATVLATPSDVVSPRTNVTLYGVVDKGFEPTDTGQRVSLRMDSGSLLGLQFVINGRENSGCGQFLNLQFEGGFSQNGQAAENTSALKKQAWARLSGDWGNARMGRQPPPAYSTVAPMLYAFGLVRMGSGSNISTKIA